MGRPKKTIVEYEKEAIKVGRCLIHKTAHLARHIYQLRHGKLPLEIHVCHHKARQVAAKNMKRSGK